MHISINLVLGIIFANVFYTCADRECAARGCGATLVRHDFANAKCNVMFTCNNRGNHGQCRQDLSHYQLVCPYWEQDSNHSRHIYTGRCPYGSTNHVVDQACGACSPPVASTSPPQTYYYSGGR
ncbi:uncharacterized protein PGTG_06968 [Puccinia graminis f. sp. tritici CRL 75-36-700-3]|uniref:Secreted protein n=1 Tax=Puccinia graminis f. sp. tritici (strain CRL 75-36-700-3 / race SCCL) TaxID=418459 RepID=E3KAT8_PUCGT|nr:uncharacterized protein PGTG_06968 [Puccinia graminis f. sp. tritici CRL 75-36-700-3]EFP81347.2 hypothetical protein PGTG_06968 [Puccinia graminis f. sp. tritici CRL 75-36-700-3]